MKIKLAIINLVFSITGIIGIRLYWASNPVIEKPPVEMVIAQIAEKIQNNQFKSINDKDINDLKNVAADHNALKESGKLKNIYCNLIELYLLVSSVIILMFAKSANQSLKGSA